MISARDRRGLGLGRESYRRDTRTTLIHHSHRSRLTTQIEKPSGTTPVFLDEILIGLRYSDDMTEPLIGPPLSLDFAAALEAQCYTDPEIFDREKRAVLASSWQLIANSNELASTGDHVINEIAGQPIVVVRDETGSLNGFHNVCRHRAGPLATCNGHGARTLRCKYHGWTYNLKGQLRAAPEMAEARNFDPATISLRPIRVREWQGLVFVALMDAAPDFDAVFGGIAGRIHPVDLSAMTLSERASYDVECNWKVYVDNFLEGYHLPHVHPGLSKILNYREYETELFDWYSLQHSPLDNAGEIYGEGEAWYYFVYPNTMLNIMPDRLQTNRVVPLDIDHCRVEFDYYYSGNGAARIGKDLEFSDAIQMEDITICESVQKGLGTGTYIPGRLSPKRESGVWHFQNLLRRAYRAE